MKDTPPVGYVALMMDTEMPTPEGYVKGVVHFVLAKDLVLDPAAHDQIKKIVANRFADLLDNVTEDHL